MNSHIRNHNQIFIIQTEKNGHASAKKLNLDREDSSEEDKPFGFPPIVFTKPEKGYAKDCWLTKIDEKDGSDEVEKSGMQYYVQTICKSATDEFLNAECLYPTLPEKSKDNDKSEKNKMKTLHYSTKIKAQEIYLSYPCLVSNIGLSRIMIQSFTCPNQVFSLSLNEEKIKS